MNLKLQKAHKKQIKRTKENSRLRKVGHLGTRTGRLKVQKRKQKLFLDKVCEMILTAKKEKDENTLESEMEKLSPTNA